MPFSRSLRFLVALFAVPVFIAVAASLSRADSHCPASCIGGTCWTTSARDTTYNCCTAGYDLVRGRVHAYACGGGGIRVVAVDEFVVLGATPGASLAFEGRLTFSGCGSPPGHDVGAGFEAGISVGTNSRSTGYVMQCLSGVLTLPIVMRAGEAFLLSFSVAGGANSGTFDCGNASGTLDFAGLPPGVSVASCQGFRQEFPVPTRSESWGRVKARYH